LAFSSQGTCTGLFDGSVYDERHRDAYDVAARWVDQERQPRRCRTWDTDRPGSMRLVRTVEVPSQIDADDSATRSWRWYVRSRSADDDGSRTASEPQLLAEHLERAEQHARSLVTSLGVSEPEASAVAMAARWHGLGKNRAVWQRSIFNSDYPGRVLAKSGGLMSPRDLTGFRHEFGSLLDVTGTPEFQAASPDQQALVLHLIAAHHGRARPNFATSEAFDRERSDEGARRMAAEVPQRFARLQRTYGRWGLAYLESLVRAADVLASQADDGQDRRTDIENVERSSTR
jgi:CRISPR-associated endonuclease/helicase Cas3